MPIIDIYSYIVLLPLIFIAGFIDSIAGGGGLISIPAYLIIGLPPHYALGNNKFSSTIGTFYSAIRYFKAKFVNIKIALFSAFFALMGSFLGSKTVLLINTESLKYILLFLIPIITIITIFTQIGKYNFSDNIKLKKQFIVSSIFSILIGFYDGFFGPGTGAFLIICFTLFLKYDYKRANANTKIINLSSNIAALIVFILNAKIIYTIAIPAAIFGILGNVLGAKLVIKKGNKIIKPVFIIVMIILYIKIIVDYF